VPPATVRPETACADKACHASTAVPSCSLALAVRTTACHNPPCRLLSLQELSRLGIDHVTVPRGGETTYHGPGQLVAYPIVDLRQLGLGARAFVEGLEDAMVQAVGCFGIQVRVAQDTAGVTKCRCREGCDNSFRQLRLLVQLGLLGCVEIRGSWA
jgi:hypothetical protein